MPYISIKMVVMPISLFFSNGLLLVLACNHPRPGRGSVVALIFRKRYGALRAATRRGSAENGRGAHHISGEVSEVFFFPASSLHGFMACPAGAWCACRCFALKRDLVCGLCLTAFWTYAIFLPKFRPTSSWLHVSYQLFICFTGWIKWWSQHL